MYEQMRVGADPVILSIHNDKLHVLLHKREKSPGKNKYELPGGLLQRNERAEESLKRKLHETVGYEKTFFQQFHTFTEPKRDPRERTISIGFIALVSWEKIQDSSLWFSLNDLPQLAFDHKDIIDSARSFLQENVSTQLVRHFMPTLFPLNDLQKVYEVIEDTRYDNRNFRKKMISAGVVEETEERETNVSHRPAKLFRFV